MEVQTGNVEANANNQAGNVEANTSSSTAGSTEANTGDQTKAGATGPDGSKWDEETTAYIKQLRTESADKRTKNKELSDNVKALNEKFSTLQTGIAKALGIETEATPEQQLEQVQGKAYELETQNFMLNTMMEKGINKDQADYFSFLVEKRANELGENEEMTEEMLDSIVADVHKVSGASGNNSTSVQTGSPNGTSPAGNIANTGPSIEEFAKMNTTEKSQIYAKSPEMYNTLMTQAVTKNLI